MGKDRVARGGVACVWVVGRGKLACQYPTKYTRCTACCTLSPLNTDKKKRETLVSLSSTQSRGRTGTGVNLLVFETSASTDSAIWASDFSEMVYKYTTIFYICKIFTNFFDECVNILLFVAVQCNPFSGYHSRGGRIPRQSPLRSQAYSPG